MASKASAVAGAAAAGVAGAASFAYLSFSRPKKSADAPSEEQKTMKQLFLVKPSKDVTKVELAVKEVLIPTPKKGQVLVKMVAAAVNPSDYRFWFQGTGKEPSPIGMEGSGIVVASGGGMAANRLVGKTVGVTCQGGGTYTEYLCVDAMRGASVIDDNIKPEDAASCFVNPYTVLSIFDAAASRDSNAFIHTAAASQLGQMMVKLAPSRGMTVVNLVRRQDQVELLKELGAEYIVSTSDDNWEQQLSTLIEKLGIKVAFDAIAGDMSGTLLSLLPSKGTCFVYGGLSKQPFSNVSTIDLIYESKRLEGHFLKAWIYSGGTLATMRRLAKANKLVNGGLVEGGWAETSFVDCTMDDVFAKFVEMWEGEGFTGKKLRIRMDA